LPGHPAETYEFYGRLSEELRWLFDGRQFSRVLDIGCGTGALYEPMGFERADKYTGVDFSPSMLKVFEVSHPSVRLVCQSGDEYCDDETYDLIFANGVIQFFDARMMDRFLSNASRMLDPSGMIVLGLVPWRVLRWQYRVGDLACERGIPLWRRLAAYGRRLIRDDMPFWFTRREIRRAVEPFGFRANFYGSLTHPYRFHAVLTKGKA
jgi:SAM-dependent methyltransferase